jgi:hypothetical protein
MRMMEENRLPQENRKSNLPDIDMFRQRVRLGVGEGDYPFQNGGWGNGVGTNQSPNRSPQLGMPSPSSDERL